MQNLNSNIYTDRFHSTKLHRNRNARYYLIRRFFEYNSQEITYRRFGGADVMCQKRDKMFYTLELNPTPCSLLLHLPSIIQFKENNGYVFCCLYEVYVNNITRHLQPTLVVYNDRDNFIWRIIHYYARLYYHNASNDYIILYRAGNVCHYVILFYYLYVLSANVLHWTSLQD